MQLSQLVGSRIQKARKRNKLTLEQVAKKLDYNLSSLSKIERGEYEASYQTLVDLALLYDVDISYFFNAESVNTKGLSLSVLNLISEIENDVFSDSEVEKIISYIRFIKYERNQ